MDEFSLIEVITAELGAQCRAPWMSIGPGDDAAVIRSEPGTDQVVSIDTLLAGVHFPVSARHDLIGYRSVMVATSDLAAMGAKPKYALVSLVLDAQGNKAEQDVRQLAAGIRQAAELCDLKICGGNLAQGPMTLSISVHGEVPEGQALTRSGAQLGDVLQVSGPIGGAGLCVSQQAFEVVGELSAMQEKYYHPQARVDLVDVVRRASAGIDISDGLLADLSHLLRASGMGCELDGDAIPLFPGADLHESLTCGDDYELLISAQDVLPGFHAIGRVTTGPEMVLDGEVVTAGGFNHFSA